MLKKLSKCIYGLIYNLTNTVLIKGLSVITMAVSDVTYYIHDIFNRLADHLDNMSETIRRKLLIAEYELSNVKGEHTFIVKFFRHRINSDQAHAQFTEIVSQIPVIKWFGPAPRLDCYEFLVVVKDEHTAQLLKLLASDSRPFDYDDLWLFDKRQEHR